MKLVIKAITLLTILIFFVVIPLSQAQDAVLPEATSDDIQGADTNSVDVNNPDEENYSYGTVVSTAADSITIQEYDFDKDQDIQMIYTVDASTNLNGLSAITDLVKDDNVEVYFKEAEGKKIATAVLKEEEDEYDENVADDAADIPADEGDVMEPEAADVPANDEPAPAAGQ